LKCHKLDNIADPAAQVAPTATEAELKKAYKTGALKYHPGKLAQQDITF
jgi:hypothetical protein